MRLSLVPISSTPPFTEEPLSRSIRSAWLASLLSTATFAVVAASTDYGYAQSPDPALQREVSTLNVRVDRLNARLDAQAKKPKDAWDKLQSMSGLVSGALVALIGALATYVYNDRQTKSQASQTEREVAVQQVQTVASFMPYLQATEPRQKQAALLSISALGNAELAVKLAGMYRDEGSVDALARFASNSDDPVTAAAAERSLDAIYNALRASVVRIIKEDRLRGTGFAFRNGMILTANHVARGAIELDVELADGQRSRCGVLGSDEESGIGVLRLEGEGPPHLVVTDRAPGHAGEVIVLGFGTEGWSTSTGRILGVTRTTDSQGTARTLVRTSLQVEPGYGGAPVLDRTGEVVGLVYMTDRDRNEAFHLSAGVIRAGLDRLGLADPAAPGP